MSTETEVRASDTTIAVINPATEQEIARIPDQGMDAINAAVTRARAGFEAQAWRDLSGDERASILWKVSDRLQAETERLAALETAELGSPVPLSRAMVANCAEAFRYYAGWCGKIHGRAIDVGQGAGSGLGYTMREPVGVAAMIIPWNAPMMIGGWKLAPALAAGCSIVIKPSEDAPLTTMELARLITEAGVPDDVVNVITGGAAAGAALAEHVGVDKISFTGSTRVGRSIVRAAAGNFKRVTLELGGKSPLIVLGDADLDAAVQGIVQALAFNSGQVCVCGSRVFVQRQVHDALMSKLRTAIASIAPGDPLAAGTMMGPLISARQLARVSDLVESGRAEGAEILTGGQPQAGLGYYYPATVVTNLDPSARLMREEVFGPVVSVITFDDDEEAVALANDTDYGLAAYLWTLSLPRAHRIAKAIRAGTVWINSGPVINFGLPMGGYKASGWGREGGPEGLDAYLETKSIYLAL